MIQYNSRFFYVVRQIQSVHPSSEEYSDCKAIKGFCCSVCWDCNVKCDQQSFFYMEEVKDPMGDGNCKFLSSSDWCRQFGYIGKTILLWSYVVELLYLVRSKERGAHNLLKPEVLSLVPRWRIRWYARVYQSRDEMSLCVDQILAQVLGV